MDTKKLRQKILDLAIRGKLVPQDPNDEPASVLLERIRAEKERLIKEGKIKRSKKSASDTPHYENEAPFEVPKSWEWIQIKDVCEVARGGSPRPIKDYLTNDPSGVNWIKIGDTTKDGKYIDSAKEKIKLEGVRKSRIVHKGDFLLTNSMSFGRPYILRIDGCIHDGWLVISPMSNSYQSDFLYYLLSSIFAYEQFSKVASGGVVTNLNSDKVADSFFPLPPYKEQIRIIEEIEKWFALIDTLESAKEDLRTSISQAKSKILDLAIHGKLVPQDPNDEPAIELLKRINPNFTPCDNAHYENVPSNWVLARVEDIGQLLSGRDLTNDDCNTENKGLPYLIGASNIEGNTFSFIRWTERPQVISQMGDMLISCKGTIGAIVKNNIGNMHIARQFMAIRPNKNCITSDYLHICLIAMIEEIKKDARGVIPGIARDDLLTKVFPIPPLNEQRRITTAINQYHSVLDNISVNL